MSAGQGPAYRLDGRSVSREAFYAAACDPRRSVVVEACAGAGKTWMLVSRILRALLDGAQPHEILAITFTRKAAGEMRERLAEWLRAFADGSDAQREDALRQRGLDAAQAARLAPALAGLHDRLLASGRPVEVRTFHAWFSQLLRAAPWDLLAELGLQPEMALIEDLDELRGELFRRFHAAVLADARLLDEFQRLSVRRGRHTLRRWLEAAWARRSEIALADEAGHLAAGVEPAHARFAELAPGEHPAALLRRGGLADELPALARALGALGKITPVRAAQALEAALALPDESAALEGVLRALFTVEGRGPARKNLGELPLCAQVCTALERVREAVEQQRAHEEHQGMVRLSRLLLAEYAALKRQRALIDMDDLERVAHALLADSALSAWVQERLDARVRHLLIDEFQDTSPLQWHTLQAWLSGYAGAGGGPSPPALFIVGDPKQSIYRFRRAEPRVFAAAREFVQQGLGGAVLECDHTRRNAPAVIDAVNAVFGGLHAQGCFDGWRAHTTEVREPAGEVRALPGVERPRRGRAELPPEPVWRDSLSVPRREAETVLREAEAAGVASAVQALVDAGNACSDILVLSRKRASLRLVAAALQARGVPYAEPERSALTERPEVRDLLALLDVLASPGHDLSLAHALKSPLFGADDGVLLALAQAAEGQGSWWNALMAGHGRGAAAQRARTLLARWAAAARELPPHDLLDRVVHEGELMQRLAAAVPPARGAAALDAVQALLAQALQLDGGRYATPYGFVRALRQRAAKAAPALPGDAVKLLTVHGAKGLEAGSVFIVDAQPEPQPAEQAALLVDWPVDAPSPLRVAFVASEARCPPSLRALLDAEQAARTREEFNTWYVAMTRARERLVVSRTPPRVEGPASLWERLLPLAGPWAMTDERRPHPARGDDAEVPVLHALRRPPPAPPATARPAAALDERAARLGSAVHRVLEWAAPGSHGPASQGHAADLAALAAAAAQQSGLGQDAAAEVRRVAGQVLHSPACARFFDRSALRWAGNEVPVGEGGEALRIDRLVCLDAADGPQWWVLDYKLQQSPGELGVYREQMVRYRRAVQALQPGDTVRAAFITGSGQLVELDD